MRVVPNIPAHAGAKSLRSSPVWVFGSLQFVGGSLLPRGVAAADLAESGCRGPSILNTAFLADAQESLKVTRQPHTTGRTNDLVSAPLQ